tara:strand:- start:523 stop:813 length:291 start_codon:yes stop_codon:yes gene_type:complete
MKGVHIMQDDKNFINLKELRTQMDHLDRVDNSGALTLLQTMSIALTAKAAQLIGTSQLVEITDRVEVTKDMEKGIDRDLHFEKTRKLLSEMIGYIE